MSPKSTSIHPRAAFGHRDFRYFLGSRFLVLIAYQMLIVAVSQSIFERTGDPLALGLIGLALFVPKIAFTLPAGHAADRHDRRRILIISRVVQIVLIACLIGFFRTDLGLPILYVLLFLMGITNAYGGPASQAYITQLVPEAHFGNAVAWTSSSMQIGFVIGPAAGGGLYALWRNPESVLLAVGLMWIFSSLLLLPMEPKTEHIQTSDLSWKTLMAGLHYVFKRKVILGAISLDLVAVLLGGAAALMPIYANDILEVGPSGLGLLRAAPSLGAAAMAIYLAYAPPLQRAGKTMLWCVALFGLFTILFGVSRNFAFSLACLVGLGASDMVSVVVRHTLVQMKTPPEMRGRVSAVNIVFIGASNELGEFESGIAARWLGTVTSVVVGGLATLAVVGIWSWRFPEIRKLGRLTEETEAQPPLDRPAGP